MDFRGQILRAHISTPMLCPKIITPDFAMGGPAHLWIIPWIIRQKSGTHCQSKDRNNQSNVKVGTIILSCDWLKSLGSEERSTMRIPSLCLNELIIWGICAIKKEQLKLHWSKIHAPIDSASFYRATVTHDKERALTIVSSYDPAEENKRRVVTICRNRSISAKVKDTDTSDIKELIVQKALEKWVNFL